MYITPVLTCSIKKSTIQNENIDWLIIDYGKVLLQFKSFQLYHLFFIVNQLVFLCKINIKAAIVSPLEKTENSSLWRAPNHVTILHAPNLVNTPAD